MAVTYDLGRPIPLTQRRVSPMPGGWSVAFTGAKPHTVIVAAAKLELGSELFPPPHFGSLV